MIDHNAILRLAQKRLPPKEIANRLGLERRQVAGSLARLRKNGEAIPEYSRKCSRKRCRVSVEPHVHDNLTSFADARGCEVSEIAALILDRVVLDDLVEAVLDDGGADGR